MNLQIIRQFKSKLNQCFVAGLFMKTGDAAFVEASGYGGFDFCILDTEHGPCSYENLQNLIRAAECVNMLPIVRVALNNEDYIGKALDIGAAGIQIPQVCTREDAVSAVKHSKFYPLGERGVCRFVRAAGYSSQDRFQYFKQSNNALLILQVEGQKGIENIDDILSVKGVDIIFIGPYDLSQSLGVTGDVHHQKVVEHMKTVINKANKHGVCVGTFVDSVEDGCIWKNLGIKYIAHSVDVGIFYEACRSVVDKFKAHIS